MVSSCWVAEHNYQDWNILFTVGKANKFSDSFVLTGLIEAAALEYSGLKIEELSLDEKAEILFLDQGYEISLRHLFLLVCWFCPNVWSSLEYQCLFAPNSDVNHFLYRRIATTVVLAVLYSLTKSFSPLPDDIYRYGK